MLYRIFGSYEVFMKKSILFSVFVLMLSISIVDTCQGQNATNYIMSNYDFTNRKAYTAEQLHKVFDYAYSWDDIQYAYEVFVSKGLNPLLFYLIAQKEGMPRDNYMLGCGIHLNRTWYKAFGSQVWACAVTLRYWYDNAKEEKWNVYIAERKQRVPMWNSATYSFYKYTPHYRVKIKTLNYECGNFVVKGIWHDLKDQMEGK